MQTPMSKRPGSLEVQQKPSLSTPRVVRKLKAPGSDSDYSIGRLPKDKSPKVVDRRSPRNLANERKSPTKLIELESQVSWLQDELKKARHEAEESKKQLEETQNQLNEISESEDNRIQQLREISHDRDRAWQSELEAIQKRSSMESAALASAKSEIHKLKSQLERVSDSEAHLRDELSETLDLVSKLKEKLDDSREEVSQAEMELEVVKTVSVATPHDSLVMELEESKSRVKSLEELIGHMSVEVKKNEEGDQESGILKTEVTRLRLELESAEKNYRDEYIRSTLEIREAFELVERAKSEFRKREVELEAELEELRLKSTKKDGVEAESVLESMKQENQTLRSEMEKREMDFKKENEEGLVKVRSLTEDVVNSSRRAARMMEELEATQATNMETEAELRRLKVQCDQWRKAAEAAAAIVSSVGNNGKCVERTGSMDWRRIGRKLELDNLDDTDDEEDVSPKKWNGNVLRKIGVMLKKGQK